MAVVAFKCLGRQLLLICVIITACAGLSWLVDGKKEALGLLKTAVWGMKAPWVWTFGWGLAGIVAIRGRMLPVALDGVLVSNEHTVAAMARIEQSTMHQKAWRYTVPITCFGVFFTHMYGIPNGGIAHWLIFAGVCSIYYVAAYLLSHFIGMINAFDIIAKAVADVEFKRVFSPLSLESLTTYLATTTILGVMSIYSGFRGTLTAGFQFHDDVWRIFLVTPLILFLPGTLFYNYYPSYVLRKVVQFKVLKTMERLGSSDDHEARSLFLDLRENIATSSRILPFVDYKTVPSYLLAIGCGISMAYSGDPVVKEFLKRVLYLE